MAHRAHEPLVPTLVTLTGPDDSRYAVVRNWSAPSVTPLPAVRPINAALGAEATAWSPDGRYFASGGADFFDGPNTVYVYERNGVTLTRLPNPATNPVDSVRSLAWSPDGRFLAIGSMAGAGFYVYERSGGTLTNCTVSHSDQEVMDVFWSPDGGTVYSLSHGFPSTLRALNRSGNTFTSAWTLTFGNDTYVSGDISSDGTAIFVGLDGSTTGYMINVASLATTSPSIPSTVAGGGCAWSPRGDVLAIGLAQGVHLFRRAGNTLTLMTQPPALAPSGLSSPCWSPCGRYLACVDSSTTKVAVFERKGDMYSALPLPSVSPSGAFPAVQGLAWSPDGRFLSFGMYGTLGGVATDFGIYQTTGTIPPGAPRPLVPKDL